METRNFVSINITTVYRWKGEVTSQLLPEAQPSSASGSVEEGTGFWLDGSLYLLPLEMVDV